MEPRKVHVHGHTAEVGKAEQESEVRDAETTCLPQPARFVLRLTQCHY